MKLILTEIIIIIENEIGSKEHIFYGNNKKMKKFVMEKIKKKHKLSNIV